MTTLIQQPAGSSLCGQCVMAMMTGLPFDKVVEAMGSGRNYPADMKKAAAKLGVTITTRSLPIANGVGPPNVRGLVFCFVPQDGRDHAHWIYWDGERFLDPRGAITDTVPLDWKCGIYHVLMTPQD